MYFPQQRHLQCFLFRIRSHNYVYLIILVTQEEERNQLFHQLSVEFLVRSINFIHFIHPYMNPQPFFDDICLALTIFNMDILLNFSSCFLHVFNNFLASRMNLKPVLVFYADFEQPANISKDSLKKSSQIQSFFKKSPLINVVQGLCIYEAITRIDLTNNLKIVKKFDL